MYVINHINNIIKPFKTKKRAITRLPFKNGKYIIFLFMYTFYT